MESSSDKLIKILNRERKELKEEINYYRYLLELTYGMVEPEPIPTRQEETCGPMLIDGLVKEILMG